jgi:hypothetical protein
VIHAEALGGGTDRTSARDGKKIANVVPIDHGAIPHHAVRLPKPVSNTSNSDTDGVSFAYAGDRDPIPNDGHRSSWPTSIV